MFFVRLTETLPSGILAITLRTDGRSPKLVHLDSPVTSDVEVQMIR